MRLKTYFTTGKRLLSVDCLKFSPKRNKRDSYTIIHDGCTLKYVQESLRRDRILNLHKF